MRKITLVGPETTVTLETDNTRAFIDFVKWLLKFNSAESPTFKLYPIQTEPRLAAAVVKARRLGLTDK